MGNGTKFKLSSMFPSVLSKIKGITGKKPKGKGSLTIPSDWSDEMPDFSTASKDSPCSPPSPVRTFPQSREREMRFCSSPHCSSPINHNKSYDIRFPTESPLRRGMKSRPVSPPRRSANSTDSGCCSFDSTLPQDRIRRAMPPLFGRCVHHQQQQQPRSSKCNSYNSDTHSDSELDITDSEPQSTTSRSHLRARTMSLQLDGTTEWERERERERDWSEPEKSASSSSRRRRPRDSPMSKKISSAGEPSPILHTVRCMPPNIIPTNFSSSDHHHHHPHPDYMSRDQNASSLPRFDRKLSFTTDDNRLFEDNYTSFSSDEDFFKVRSSTNGGGAKANGNGIGQYRLKNLTSYGTSELDLPETEDEKRSFRRETVLAKTVLNASAAAAAGSDGWARVQSRFADEDKHAQLQHQHHQQQQQQLLQQTMMRMGRVSYDRKATAAAGDESELLLTEDERLHVAMCRREASLVKTVLSAKDWARENLRALSKASELEKQAKQQLRGTTTTEESMVEYESFGLPVIHKEHVQQSRGSSRTHSPVVVVGEVEEKHTKGRIDYQSSPNDHHHHHQHHYPDQGSDNLVYEQFSQPLAEYASDFYKNAQTEESDFETNGGSRTWEVEFPSFRSDRGSRRSGPVELLLESERLTPRNHKYSGQERSARTPKKQNLTSNSTASATTTAREVLGRKFNRSASSPKVQDLPVNSMKPSSRSGSPRKQEPLVHTSSSGGKRATSPRTAGPPSSIRQETVSKKISRSQSPRQEVSGKTASSNSLSPVQQQDVSGNKVVNNKVSGRSVSPAQSSPDSKKKKKGNTRATSNQSRPQEERASVMGSDSVAVVKSSYDPYQDFRESMVEMILENDIQTAEDLEELLQCYLSLNSAEYHSIIVQVFSDIWRDIFDH